MRKNWTNVDSPKGVEPQEEEQDDEQALHGAHRVARVGTDFVRLDPSIISGWGRGDSLKKHAKGCQRLSEVS